MNIRLDLPPAVEPLDAGDLVPDHDVRPAVPEPEAVDVSWMRARQLAGEGPGVDLPDPWPNMLVEVQADSADEWDRGAIRRAYRARHGTLYVHVEGLENPVQWHPDEIREVRTPDGTTLWKRPAAKVTT